jgi:hypothetical protein
VIDNSPAPLRLVNADALVEELKFYPRRPRLKSARPGQARHFATHTQGLFRVIRVGSTRSQCGRLVRFGPFATDLLRPSNPPVSATSRIPTAVLRWVSRTEINVKLFYAPGSSSLFPHIMLHEAGLPFTAIKIDEHTKVIEGGGDYRNVNPLARLRASPGAR